ncbi:MAG: hypothetical protein WAP35_10600 [Solirubrobacterales bacterium]
MESEARLMSPVAELSQSPIPADAYDKFPGQWVAIRHGQIVANADSFEALKAREEVLESDVLFRVPEQNAHYF